MREVILFILIILIGLAGCTQAPTIIRPECPAPIIKMETRMVEDPACEIALDNTTTELDQCMIRNGLLEYLNKGISIAEYRQKASQYEDYTGKSLKQYQYIAIPSAEIKNKAEELNDSTIEESINNVDNFLAEIRYEYKRYPATIDDTLKDMVGDCTDITQLGVEILRYQSIYARPVHGWATDAEGSKIKHDWIEVLVPTDRGMAWEEHDMYFNYPKLYKIGDGVW